MYPARWYLLNPGGNSTHLHHLNDGSRKTCHEFGNGPHLLKATKPRSYDTRNVAVYIKQPLINFNWTHTPCNIPPSLLLTHGTGTDCNPFCQVPGTCQFLDVSYKGYPMIKYSFVCKCTVDECRDIFLNLQPQLDRDVVEICMINDWKRTCTINGDDPIDAWTKCPTFSWRHFQNNFLQWNVCILIRVALNFVPNGPFINKSALIQIWLGPLSAYKD